MKHNFKFYAAMACSAIALASCSSEAVEDVKTVGKQQMVFTAEQEINAGSRTSLGGDLSVLWATGDMLSVLDGKNNNDFILTSGEGTASAEFAGTAKPATTYYAVYPFQSNASVSGNVISGVVIPTEQHATEGTFDPKASIMTAVSDQTNNFQFKNASSSARIITTADCKKITFTAGATDKIAGKFSMTVDADGIITASTATDATNAVTLVPSGDATSFPEGTYYITINPGTISSLKVECEYTDKTLYQSVDYPIAMFKRGTIINLGTASVEGGWKEATPSINGHEYVKIGGIKWATMNVGATTVAGDPATCYGDYFAWGETEPRYTGKTINSATSIKFAGWSTSHSSGYSSSDFPIYTGTTLDAEHDAARANWSSTWRTPTHEEYVALYAACGGTGSYIESTFPIGTPSTTAKGIYRCTDYNGIKGFLFCDGTNKVFFPAAGRVGKTSFYEGGLSGYYWSSSLDTSDANYAYYLYFYSTRVNPSNTNYRYYGQTVRPVSD